MSLSPITTFILLFSSPQDWNFISILLFFFLATSYFYRIFFLNGNRDFSFFLFFRQQESLLSSQPGVGTWWREAIWTTTSTGLKANSLHRCVCFWPVTFDIIPVLVLPVTNHRFQCSSATSWLAKSVSLIVFPPLQQPLNKRAQNRECSAFYNFNEWACSFFFPFFFLFCCLSLIRTYTVQVQKHG